MEWAGTSQKKALDKKDKKLAVKIMQLAVCSRQWARGCRLCVGV
jgi:hypothetical protein